MMIKAKGQSQQRTGYVNAADQAREYVVTSHEPGEGWYHVKISTYLGVDTDLTARPRVYLKIDGSDRGDIPTYPFDVAHHEMPYVKIVRDIKIVQRAADTDLVTLSSTIVLTPIDCPCK